MLPEALSTVVAVPVCVYLLPGVNAPDYEFALMAGGMMAVIYLLLRPLARLLAKPLSCFTFGLIGTVVDAGMVELCVYIMDGGFTVESFWWALATALVINVIRSIIHMMFGKK